MKNDRTVLGVGINDADYVVKPRVNGRQVYCPFYLCWKNMLIRVYSVAEHARNPTYIGCSVVEEWLTFSNFKAWMKTQDWEGKALDKDLLVPGNKVYGPETCVFVSRMVNTFVLELTATRGDYPIGVSFHKRDKVFTSYVNNPFTKKLEHLGRFNTPDDAHKAWLKRKLEFAKQIAVLQTDDRIANALIKRYTEYENTSGKRT